MNQTKIASQDLTKRQNILEMSTQGCVVAGIAIAGTWVGTIVVEGFDGQSWSTLTDQNGTALSSITGNATHIVDVSHIRKMRVRMSAYTSGTAKASIYLNSGAGPVGGLVKIFADVWDSANHVLNVVMKNPLNNLIDKITSYQATDSIMLGTTALTPKFFFANVAASQTDANLVTAVTSKKIRVLALFALSGATATTLTLNTKPVGAGSAISPLLANGANGGEVLPFNPVGWCETSSGEGLTATTGSGASTGIMGVYIEV